MDPHDRLKHILSIDRKYGNDIIEFLTQNPIFVDYLKVIPFSPRSSTKHTSVKDAIKYYVCHAGVRNDYGDRLFSEVKRGCYDNLKSKLATILEIDKLPDIKSSADVDSIQIKGVGPGCKTYIKHNLFNDFENATYETDLIFRKGLSKIYKLPGVCTVTEAKRITKTWTGPKYVGTVLCFQAHHYT